MLSSNINPKIGKSEKLEINYQYQLDADLLALLVQFLFLIYIF